MLGGAGDGRPALDTDAKMAEAILALSGTTNGRLAVEGFRRLEERTGTRARRPRRGQRGEADHLRRHPGPAGAGASPARSGPGSETGGRRYAPFTVNVERLKPWHTLTGRMHFFLDHDWMHELGETLPIYRPPLDMHRLFGEPAIGARRRASRSTVRYLTPHSKWSIHSEYQDNLFMLVALPRRTDGVDERRGRRRDRRARQRLGRGGQPQRRAGGPRDRQPPDAGAASCSSTTPRSAW